MREREIFFGALDIEEPGAREAYLQGACGKDLALRNKVDELLKEHRANDSLLRHAAVEGAATVLGEAPAFESVGSQIGRYKLQQKIGEGGFGVVYMAEQREPVKRQVALKIIKVGMDTRQVVARFEAERQALAMMDHPNIAKVLDAGATDTGRPYFVMELVKGFPLTQYCDDHQLNTRERLELFIPVCLAIQHAHQKGIIHRDIKPSNVMVTLHDGVPVPKVIDFGIAKATQQELTEKTIFTQYQQFIGTPAYMSPEQAEMSGLDIDTRSDIYSLGVLLYELLVGRTPLDAKELLTGGYDEIRRRILQEEPKKPSTRVSTLADVERSAIARHRRLAPEQLSGELKGDLDWIVLKALEKDRTRRYDTANGLAMDIRRFLDVEPVLAAPPSQAYRVRKYVRRHRTGLAVVAVIGLVLLAAAVMSSWQALRATRAQGVAERSSRAELEQRLLAQSRQREAEEQRGRAERIQYAAQMLAARADWDNSNLHRLRSMLRSTASLPYRGFEWYYWQRQCRLDLQTLRHASGEVVGLEYSPDGRWLASGGSDGSIKLWDASSGREVWGRATHSNRVTSIRFSPDSRRLVSGDFDSVAKLWEVASGRELSSISAGGGGVDSARFGPDGATVDLGLHSGLVQQWDLTANRIATRLRVPSQKFSFVSLESEGRGILVGDREGDLALYDEATGKERFQAPLMAEDSNPGWSWVTDALMTGGGRRIVCSHSHGVIRILDTNDGSQIRSIHSPATWDISLSADGAGLATAGYFDRMVHLLNLNNGQERVAWKGHAAKALSVAMHPDGTRMASGDAEGLIKVWETSPGREMQTIHAGDLSLNESVFSADGRRILTSDWRDGTRLWDVETGREIRRYAFAAPSALFPDGRRLIACRGGNFAGDNVPVVLDVASGEVIAVVNAEMVLSIAISPDGRRFVTAEKQGRARIWDAETLQPLIELSSEWGEIGLVSYSPDGRLLAVALEERITFWDANSGKVRGSLEEVDGGDGFRSLAFSPDGTRLVTGGNNGQATVWEVATGRRLFALEGHTDYVTSVGYSPDGRRIVTGSNDSTVKVWDAETGAELLSLRGAGPSIVRATFSPDGRMLMSACAGFPALVSVWRTASVEDAERWMREETADREMLQQRFAKEAASRETLSRAKRTSDDEVERLTREGPPFRPWVQANPGAILGLGVLRDWLVLAPLPATNLFALMTEILPGEAGLTPRAGDRVSAAGKTLEWETYRAVGPGMVDFGKLTGNVAGSNLGYAVTYLHSTRAQKGLRLLVSSDDGARIFLNGRELYRNLAPKRLAPLEYEISGVELREGLNVLVFKVFDAGVIWQSSARLLGADDLPVEGVIATSQPDRPGR